MLSPNKNLGGQGNRAKGDEVVIKFFGWLALWPMITPIRLGVGVTATLLYIVGLFVLGVYLLFRRPRRKAPIDDEPRTVINQYFYGNEPWPLPVQQVQAYPPAQHAAGLNAAAQHPSRQGRAFGHKPARHLLPSWSFGDKGMN